MSPPRTSTYLIGPSVLSWICRFLLGFLYPSESPLLMQQLELPRLFLAHLIMSFVLFLSASDDLGLKSETGSWSPSSNRISTVTVVDWTGSPLSFISRISLWEESSCSETERLVLTSPVYRLTLNRDESNGLPVPDFPCL
uniref:Uncharacterized protein n=1 Tax=Denticeps clupeoides TaxID=299321 RepID=A0AAY4BDM6_9TELE